MRFFGLLHLDECESSVVNAGVRDFPHQITLYVENAINLSNSLRTHGLDFTLLTNQRDVIESFSGWNAAQIDLREIKFNTEVPTGVNFYSAHFKLDVIRYLSSLQEPYVGLIDLDMICINKMPDSFIANMEQGIPMCYDISDQVIPAFGKDVITRDLVAMHKGSTESKWSGGEFLTGRPEFFAILADEVDRIYPNYTEIIDSIHHVGDEAITSAALEVLRAKGIKIVDGGPLQIVGRYWGARIKHTQKPLENFCRCFLLHMPSDKPFLSSISDRHPMDRHEFARLYSIWNKLLKNRAKRVLRGVRRVLSLFIKS